MTAPTATLCAMFDAQWYYREYSTSIDKLRVKNETLLEFYIRTGARSGHDPHAEFSEILYRINNQDVYQYLLADVNAFGYLHYLEYGQLEPGRSTPSKADIELARKICKQIDFNFIKKTHLIDFSKCISPLDYYYLRVKDLKISPSAFFSEEAYLQLNPDVSESVSHGNYRSGFAHYLDTLSTENRPSLTVQEYGEMVRSRELDKRKNMLEASLPGVTELHASEFLKTADFYTTDISISVEQTSKRGMLVLVPNYLPEIIFGGYMAFFDFLIALKEKANIDFKLAIINGAPDNTQRWNIMRMRLDRPSVANLFSSIDYLSTDRVLHVPSSYAVISYCCETHYTAHLIAKKLRTLPFFFIQEYEPDFHASGDMHTFTKNAFFLPHIGIYNSKLLLRYFMEEVGMQLVLGESYRYCCLENFIDGIGISWEAFRERYQSRAVKRLIFYGRPEAHGTRNHFGTFILGLRLAIHRGYLGSDEWEFVSIGSLAYEGNFPIAEGYKLRMLSRLPYKEYVEFIRTGDVGVSFVSTAHAGIVHFQMANYGLTTITNTTKQRSAKWLSTVNGNLIGVNLSPDGIATGLKEAIDCSTDIETRFANAREAFYMNRADCVVGAVRSVMAELGFEL
jgi:beta-1,2-rhamnosyltransferase WsaF-like protein